jgi:hypothetical protein
MSALQAFRRIEKAATILTWGWVLNNLLGSVSTVILIYFIWWRWHLGVFGMLVLLVGVWVINSTILPTLFGVLNKPFAEMAKSGAVRLVVLKAIDDDTVWKLSDTKVEHWPEIIVASMTQEEFRRWRKSFSRYGQNNTMVLLCQRPSLAQNIPTDVL